MTRFVIELNGLFVQPNPETHTGILWGPLKEAYIFHDLLAAQFLGRSLSYPVNYISITFHGFELS